jgi:uncharacterized protein YktA (UPF0223 family)
MKTILMLCLIALITSCSAGKSLRLHAAIAVEVEDVSVTARRVVLTEMRAEMEAAVVGVESVDERRRLVDAVEKKYERSVAAVNALIEVKSAYVLIVLTKAREKDPSLADALPLISSFVRAYEALRVAMGERSDKLPKIPRSLLDLAK